MKRREAAFFTVVCVVALLYDPVFEFHNSDLAFLMALACVPISIIALTLTLAFSKYLGSPLPISGTAFAVVVGTLINPPITRAILHYRD
ncbi:MAG TPA: hypothetical protein VGF18_05325, partial [Candidatus Tumulicola sp.]